MSFDRILIANRGEIAIRIARAASAQGLTAVAVYADDDADSLHVTFADEALPLPGRGVKAYLDGAAIIAAAKTAGAAAIHPGYGFLSENAQFAAAVAAAGLVFIGPPPGVLAQLGDKLQARALAEKAGVPVLPATAPGAGREAMAALLAGGPVMLKAVAGGGGRGMRHVTTLAELDGAMAAAEREAAAAFGNGTLYAERYLPAARHIEIQILADSMGHVTDLGDRDCSVQRRHQKIIEIAPAPSLAPTLRARMAADARKLALAAHYVNAGTVEFLLDPATQDYYFIEANPRLQVEHTVTEEVTGVDIVAAQIAIAQGKSLADLGLANGVAPQGLAIQVRVNLEKLDAAGTIKSSGGRLLAYEPPSGPDVRVDGAGYAGFTTSPAYDSLLAKVILRERSGDLARAAARLNRALSEFRLTGAETNIPLLRAILTHADFQNLTVTTGWLDQMLSVLAKQLPADAARHQNPVGEQPTAHRHHAHALPDGAISIDAPMRGTIVSIETAPGSEVRPGQLIAVMDAMKMQHEIKAPSGGRVLQLLASPGDTIDDGDAILFLMPDARLEAEAVSGAATDPDHIRADLAEVIARHRLTLDEARPDAVAKRRKTGHRTARENVAALIDPGSFIEYGALTIAAQRRRRSVEDLTVNTPADGLITGTGAVNGTLFDVAAARTAILAYDYTVLAGTQGTLNHKKTDRILAVAERDALPIIWFCEGGGGRPGDVDALGVTGLDVTSFEHYARLSGLAPRIGIAAGRCFAGNALFFGASDITIATEDANVGLGGPAMIEGGGLGVFKPEDIGPISVQAANGVVDLVARDEVEAASMAKKALGYFQGPLKEWQAADQRLLRASIPENRLRVYDIRAVIEGLCDTGSVLELRRAYGRGMVTALVRIAGQPLGLIANDPMFLGGAIDGDGAEKAGRFMQLCDAFDLPIVSLCDTPGFMVGPDSEKTAAVRRGSRMFVTASSMTVPTFAIILRKGYGLGAQSMTSGSFATSSFTISWPSGEFGGMGLEGAVRLGYRKELEAESDPAARQALFEKLVAKQYANGKAVSVASFLEIDAVIDPAETRHWILSGLAAFKPNPRMGRKKRPFIDTW